VAGVARHGERLRVLQGVQGAQRPGHRGVPQVHLRATSRGQPRDLRPAHERGPRLPHAAHLQCARDDSGHLAQGLGRRRRRVARGPRAQDCERPRKQDAARLQDGGGEGDHQGDGRPKAAQHLPAAGDRSAPERPLGRAQDALEPQARDRGHHRHVERPRGRGQRDGARARAASLDQTVAARFAHARNLVRRRRQPRRAVHRMAQGRASKRLLAHRLLQPAGLPDRQPSGGVPQALQGGLGARRRCQPDQGRQHGEGRGAQGARRGRVHSRPLPRRLPLG